ncbi:MAG: adenosylcobinamide-GDP ribazoletransferase [Planctomycetota bacterium]
MTAPPPVRGLRAAFVSLTRLPLGGFPYRDEDFAWAPAYAPVVGAVVGALGGATFALTVGAGPLAAALLALGITMLVTGGYHEDGLADTADALGGAIFDRERLLAILKDSRIGTYGALALVVSIGLRVALVAELAERRALGPTVAWSGAAALALAHVLGRVPPVWLMATMPYVTDEEHARSRPLARAAVPQALVATLLGVALVVTTIVLAPSAAYGVAAAFAALSLAAAVCAWRFHVRAGGVTGDFLGATEQVGEVTVLLVLALT